MDTHIAFATSLEYAALTREDQLELIEPGLSLSLDSPSAERFAHAILQKVG